MRMFRLEPDFRPFIYIFSVQRYSKVHISGYLFKMHSHACSCTHIALTIFLYIYKWNLKNHVFYVSTVRINACNTACNLFFSDASLMIRPSRCRRRGRDLHSTIRYGKAAINLPFNLRCKAVAALFFIPYCRPIWGYWPIMMISCIPGHVKKKLLLPSLLEYPYAWHRGIEVWQ